MMQQTGYVGYFYASSAMCIVIYNCGLENNMFAWDSKLRMQIYIFKVRSRGEIMKMIKRSHTDMLPKVINC